MKFKKYLWVVLLLLLVGYLGVSTNKHGIFAANNSSMQKAPVFSLPDLEGRQRSSSDFKGKVVILDFWATWCPPCVMEIPHFIELHKEYEGRGLVVVGISLDQGGVAGVKSFVKKNGINYPILIGNQKVAQDYGGIRGIPTTFVIDRQGRIVEKFVGYKDKNVFESVIKELL